MAEDWIECERCGIWWCFGDEKKRKLEGEMFWCGICTRKELEPLKELKELINNNRNPKGRGKSYEEGKKGGGDEGDDGKGEGMKKMREELQEAKEMAEEERKNGVTVKETCQNLKRKVEGMIREGKKE